MRITEECFCGLLGVVFPVEETLLRNLRVIFLVLWDLREFFEKLS